MEIKDIETFAGFFIIGAANYEDAKNEKGLVLWSKQSPNLIQVWFLKNLLSIYWVDKKRRLLKKTKSVKETNHTLTEMTRYDKPKEKRSSRGSSQQAQT